MCVPRLLGRLGGRTSVLMGTFFLAAALVTLVAGSRAWGTQGRETFRKVCYISSKFPEAPGYFHNSVPVPSGDLRSFVSVAEPNSVDMSVETSLFSKPLSPERWLGLTSGPIIEEWISFYAEGPGRAYLAKAIDRSALYVRSMEKIVGEEGVPHEVIALVYIESGFDMRAVSRKRAAGPWQFMPRTAGRFGLYVGKYLDERRDPELSTRAAVRYLKYLHGLFDSWTLAAASYNSGEGRVLRAMKEQNSRDFWSLRLPRQTREFVPKVAAVLAILADPERYGFGVPPPQAFDYDVVEVNGPVKLAAVASVCGSTQWDLERLNPALLRSMTPPGSVSFPLRVPPGTGDLCKEELSKIRYHMIARGETLSQIASRYDVSTRAIARANAITNPHRIRQGALLTIPPVIVSSTVAKAGRALAAAASSAAKVIHYTVRPGDSLWRISAKFRTTVAQLARWNDLGNVHRIKPGQVLKVFVSGGGEG